MKVSVAGSIAPISSSAHDNCSVNGMAGVLVGAMVNVSLEPRPSVRHYHCCKYLPVSFTTRYCFEQFKAA